MNAVPPRLIEMTMITSRPEELQNIQKVLLHSNAQIRSVESAYCAAIRKNGSLDSDLMFIEKARDSGSNAEKLMLREIKHDKGILAISTLVDESFFTRINDQGYVIFMIHSILETDSSRCKVMLEKISDFSWKSITPGGIDENPDRRTLVTGKHLKNS
jgi:hypothetical protein